ncbi:kelch-like protein 5 [Paramacrobiotus metropolitanus]|uniref:kelch-like protein 5 n=1 Tax=Paramacrobiotus metropolitanus TaxID=2943436 RepID=UPI00244587E1|nr:kelch-like protein 5 [Paramacrobiotus metropolitanus]
MPNNGTVDEIGHTGYRSQQDERAMRVGTHILDLRREWQNLRASGMLCDVELRGSEAHSTGIACHRSVLSVYSGYFRTMFQSGMKESKQEVVQLHNISHAILFQLIDYCYMTDIIVTDSNVQCVLIAASFLDIPVVVDACWKFMEDNMDVKNCLMLYCFADSDAHKNSALADKARALTLKHFALISQGPEFLEMPKNIVIDVVRSDDLCVAHEDDVLLTITRWLQHDFEKRRWEFWEVLQQIRQAYLSPQCSDDFLLACVNGFKDYPGAEEARSSSEHLKLLPGYSSGGSSSRHTARKSYSFEKIIVCVGGNSPEGGRRDSVDCFNPRTSKWGTFSKLPYCVSGGGLAVIKSDLFFCGGIIGRHGIPVTPRTMHYNSARAAWNDVAPMQIGRYNAGVATVGGHIYVVGGYSSDYQTLATVERYSVASNVWTYVASIPMPLTKCTVVSFDSQLYTFGGHTSDDYNGVDYAFCYDPKRDVWSELPRMPTARYCASACVGSDGLIYVIGGCGSANRLSCTEAFNPKTRQWTKQCDMSRPVYSVGVCCVDDKIYALGGDSEANSKKSIEVYDVTSDTWTISDSQLPHENWAFGCGVVEIDKQRSWE